MVCISADIMGMLTAASAERIWIRDAVLQKMIAVDLQDTKSGTKPIIPSSNLFKIQLFYDEYSVVQGFYKGCYNR